MGGKSSSFSNPTPLNKKYVGKSCVTVDCHIFATKCIIIHHNKVATYKFAPPCMDGKTFCPFDLNFLM